MDTNYKDFSEVLDYIKNSSKESAVYVGCDSKKRFHKGKHETVYVTVVVIHIDQCHGGKIFWKKDVVPTPRTNRERLLNEVGYAIDMATLLVDVVEDRQLSVHLDLNPNPNHYSSVIVTEAIGWCAGMGFTDVKVKPDSWASHAAADFYAVKFA